jgi:hypothetical protein
MSLPVKVASLGRFARKALCSGEARVIAVFERSAYVETTGGLACIGAVGNGPLNAHCSEDTQSWLRGVAVGEKLSTEVSGATVWDPRPAPALNEDLLGKGLDRLRVDARTRYPAEGFGFAIDPAKVRPAPIEALQRWLAEPIGAPDAAADLIGFGPGLTPSGDDLIGGALCALHAAGRIETANRLSAWALALARANTNRISRAHLECASQGECAEAVNDAIVALLSGEAANLDRIHSIGHTSGWDALAGVSLALSAARR